MTAKKRFPIFRPLKTNLCDCVRLCECVCERERQRKRQPSSKVESALCAEVRTLECILSVEKSLYDVMTDGPCVEGFCVCMSGPLIQSVTLSEPNALVPVSESLNDPTVDLNPQFFYHCATEVQVPQSVVSRLLVEV